MKDYMKIGDSKLINGEWWFKPDYSDNGYIFKDEYAYLNDWDSPCYVSELEFGECEAEKDGWYKCKSYETHWTILEYSRRNTLWADDAFELNDWMYMSAWIEGWDFYDVSLDYFYSFVKEGAKVWWTDPEGLTSGVYTVVRVPSNMDDWDDDTVVLLTRGNPNDEDYCEVEALFRELGDYIDPLP